MDEDNKATLDDLINTTQFELTKITPDAPEYETRLAQLERLYALKAKNRPQPRFSQDKLLETGGMLAGILVIVGYERAHVAISKGFSLLKRQ